MTAQPDTSTKQYEAPDDIWAPAFKVGHALGRDWSAADLQAIERNFKLLNAPGHLVAPITAGHLDRPILAGAPDSAQPALGVVSDAKVEGDRLLVRMSKVPEYAKQLARAGRYLSLSVELLPDISKSNISRSLGDVAKGATGPALVGLGWLGSHRGAVKDLPSLTQLYASERETILCGGFRPEELGEPVLHASERPKSLHERVAAAERNIQTLVRRTETASRTLASMPAEMPMAFSSFTPPEAADATPLGCVFADAVSARIMRDGGSQDDPKARRLAAVAVLKEWAPLPPSPNAEDAPTRADQVTQDDFRRVVEGTMWGQGGAAYGPSISKPGGVYRRSNGSATPYGFTKNPVQLAEHGDLVSE